MSERQGYVPSVLEFKPHHKVWAFGIVVLADWTQLSFQSHLVKLVCSLVVAIAQQIQKIHEGNTLVCGMFCVELRDHVCVCSYVET